jgi:hypothetical protein
MKWSIYELSYRLVCEIICVLRETVQPHNVSSLKDGQENEPRIMMHWKFVGSLSTGLSQALIATMAVESERSSLRTADISTIAGVTFGALLPVMVNAGYSSRRLHDAETDPVMVLCGLKGFNAALPFAMRPRGVLALRVLRILCFDAVRTIGGFSRPVEKTASK